MHHAVSDRKILYYYYIILYINARRQITVFRKLLRRTGGRSAAGGFTSAPRGMAIKFSLVIPHRAPQRQNVIDVFGFPSVQTHTHTHTTYTLIHARACLNLICVHEFRSRRNGILRAGKVWFSLHARVYDYYTNTQKYKNTTAYGIPFRQRLWCLSPLSQ